MRPLPSGTVTFLFSDIEGSTQLLERHGQEMGEALTRHHDLFEQVVERHHGAIFETVGDAVYAAFAQAQDAVAAALDAHRALAAEDWGPVGRLAVRIAIHTGAVERRGDHYFGPALFRCARLQVLG
ncbi:MAG: adenylate/guanylate cyclase domain-containing protein, partial [Actinomycetota bacterium]|nr:adenylate/guanylate cyclase domain-containing protein [Actinomycetota bacterium]